MPYEVQNVQIAIGFDFGALSSAGLHHEQKHAFKDKVTAELRSVLTATRLRQWKRYKPDPLRGYPPFPEPDDQGLIPDALVVDWLRRNLQAVSKSTLGCAGDACDKYCCYDPDGKWHKSREFEFTLDGNAWTTKNAAQAYVADAAPSTPDETRRELERLALHAFVSWDVRERVSAGKPAARRRRSGKTGSRARSSRARG